MKLLHTADWHLGHRLWDIDRTREHSHFLEWLLQVVRQEKPDALLVAGDVFDRQQRDEASETLFWDFLDRLTQEHPLLRVIITAGNHDNTEYLRAITSVCRRIGVQIRTDIAVDAQGKPALEDLCVPISSIQNPDETAIILACPDLNSVQDARLNVHTGVGQRAFYNQLVAFGAQRFKGMPLVLMGHAFAVGAQFSAPDGSRFTVREGGNAVNLSGLERSVTYAAFDHIHRAQALDNSKRVCYCGSALPLNFYETDYSYGINLVEFEGNAAPKVRHLEYTPQKALMRIPQSGKMNFAQILQGLSQLPRRNQQDNQAAYPYAEIVVNEDKATPAMMDELKKAAQNCKFDLCNVRCLSSDASKSSDDFLSKSADFELLQHPEAWLQKYIQDVLKQPLNEEQQRMLGKVVGEIQQKQNPAAQSKCKPLKFRKIEIGRKDGAPQTYQIDLTSSALREVGLNGLLERQADGPQILLQSLALAFFGKPIEDIPFADCLEHVMVEFATDAASIYQVRWSGSLGNTPTLRQLSPKEHSWNKKEEALAQISSILSGDFDDFCRVFTTAKEVLPALFTQDEALISFAVERLSSNTLYRQISQTLSQNTEELRTQLREKKAELNGMRSHELDGAEYDRLQNQLSLLNSKQEHEQCEVKSLEALLLWYQEFRQAEANFNQQRINCENAQRAWKKMLDKRQLLEQFDRLIPLQPIYTRIQDKKALVADYKKQIAEKQLLLHQRQQGLKEQENKYQTVQNQLASLKEELRIKNPVIVKAFLMQGAVETDEASFETLFKSQVEVTKEIQRQNAILEERHQEIKRRYDALQVKRQQLQTLSMHKPLVDNFNKVRHNLDMMHQIYVETIANSKEITLLTKQIQQALSRKETLSSEYNQSVQKTLSLQEELAARQVNNQEFTAKNLQTRIFRLADIKRDVQNATSLWKRIADNYAELLSLSENIRQTDANLRKMGSDIPQMDLAVRKAKEILDNLDKSAIWIKDGDVLNFREQLKQGQACPICGSNHHPYFAQKLQTLQTQIAEDLEEAKKRYEIAQKELSEMQTHRTRSQVRMADMQERYKTLQEEQTSYLELWKNYEYLDVSFSDASAHTNHLHRLSLLAHLQDEANRNWEQTYQENEEFFQNQGIINCDYQQLAEAHNQMTLMLKNICPLDVFEQETKKRILALENKNAENQRSTAVLMDSIQEYITLSSWKDCYKDGYENFAVELENLQQRWTTLSQSIEEETHALELLNAEIQKMEVENGMRTEKHTRQQGEISRLMGRISQNKAKIKQALAGALPEEASQQLYSKFFNCFEANGNMRKAYETQLELVRNNQAEILALSVLQKQAEEALHAEKTEMDVMLMRTDADNHVNVQYFEIEKFFNTPYNWQEIKEECKKCETNLLQSQVQFDSAQAYLLKVRGKAQMEGLSAQEDIINADSGALTQSEVQLQDSLQRMRTNQNETQKQIQALQDLFVTHKAAQDSGQIQMHRISVLQNTLEQWEKLDEMLGSRDGSKLARVVAKNRMQQIIYQSNEILQGLNPKLLLNVKKDAWGVEIINQQAFNQSVPFQNISQRDKTLILLSIALGSLGQTATS